jgi:hypothetical protein
MINYEVPEGMREKVKRKFDQFLRKEIRLID